MLALMRSDPRLRAFAEAELAPLVDPPDPEALALLELYLKHGGNKSALARTGYLSRPALYARLARLQDRLGVSLDDAEVRTALHVALLWHRLREVGQTGAPADRLRRQTGSALRSTAPSDPQCRQTGSSGPSSPTSASSAVVMASTLAGRDSP